jgi:hypothetical protein
MSFWSVKAVFRSDGVPARVVVSLVTGAVALWVAGAVVALPADGDWASTGKATLPITRADKAVRENVCMIGSFLSIEQFSATRGSPDAPGVDA